MIWAYCGLTERKVNSTSKSSPCLGKPWLCGAVWTWCVVLRIVHAHDADGKGAMAIWTQLQTLKAVQ